MDRNDGTVVADDRTDLHAVVVVIQYGRQQNLQHHVQVQHDTVDDDNDEEETCLEEMAVCSAVSIAVVEEFGHQQTIQHQVHADMIDDDVEQA